MKNSVLRLLVACCCLVLIGTSTAYADPIYNTPADWTGIRTVAPPATAGITTNDDDWLDGIVEWSITDNLDGTLDYTYTFSNFDRPGISHFTLDVSDAAIGDSALITDPLLNGNTPIDIEFGDFEGLIGAVKFDLGADGDIVYTFTSNRLPVYGHFRLKAGRSTFATNTGFDNEASEEVLDFIARPDTFSIVLNEELPTMDAPPSIILLGMGLISYLPFHRRRKRGAA